MEYHPAVKKKKKRKGMKDGCTLQCWWPDRYFAKGKRVDLNDSMCLCTRNVENKQAHSRRSSWHLRGCDWRGGPVTVQRVNGFYEWQRCFDSRRWWWSHDVVFALNSLWAKKVVFMLPKLCLNKEKQRKPLSSHQLMEMMALRCLRSC